MAEDVYIKYNCNEVQLTSYCSWVFITIFWAIYVSSFYFLNSKALPGWLKPPVTSRYFTM